MRPDIIGFQSARFLRLNLPRPIRMLQDAKDASEVVDIYRLRRLARDLVKTESLNSDLEALARGPLQRFLRDPEAAVASLRAERRLMASGSRVSLTPNDLPSDLVQKLQTREALFFDALGYARYA